jgi:fused signal recognition particle receptor
MEPLLISFVALFAILIIGGALLTVSTRRKRGESILEPGSPAHTIDASTTEAGSTDTITKEPELSEDQVREIEEALQGAEQAEQAGTPEVPEAPQERPRFRDRLGKARGLLGEYMGAVRGRSGIDQATSDDLEEALIRADVGVATTTTLLDELRGRVKDEGIKTPDELVEALKADLKKRLSTGERDLRLEGEGPNVWLFVGVNGVGKTTTIGKVGLRYAEQGHSVLMAAGDTFRAAAAEQLTVWSERASAEIVRGQEGGDPAAVIFDAIERAGARDVDLVLADTAGRLHNKFNLMEELKKVKRVAERPPAQLTEILLVLDATTGQNGLTQAKVFSEAVECTGVVLTKLDGTAKGGIALAIQTELGLPIKLVGLGETAVDLVDFDPDEFVDALFD